MLCVFLGKQLYISKFDGPAGYDLGSSSLTGSMGCSLNGVSPLATDPGFLEDTDNQMPTCLKRAFSNLKLFCLANGLQVSGIRNFTVQNMHAARNAFPWVGCKGSDTIVILKWLCFFLRLCSCNRQAGLRKTNNSYVGLLLVPKVDCRLGKGSMVMESGLLPHVFLT